MSLSTRTLVVTTLTLLLVPVYTQAQTVNGYIGVFSDSTGTQNCINVPPGIPKLLYVLAKLEGTTSGGITGAEFRIEVSNPAGWTIQYYPPTAPIVIGNPLDLDPSSQSDGSGVSIVFSTCTPPDPGGLLKLGTIFVVNTGGGLNALRVKQHSVPTNPEQACALFTLCDSPTFTSQCMSAATQPPCSTILTMNSPNILSGEPMVFETSLSPESSGGFGLNASVFRSPAFPSLSSASVTDPDSDPTGALATPPNWIAQWDFNTAGSCASTFDWQAYDNRVRNDDSNRWTVNSAFDWAPGIDGDAAVLREINSCWEFPSGGYGNNWDYAIKVEYQTPPSGDLHLRFNYVVSCENLQLGAEIIAYDALSVEADSDCNSFDINFDLDETLTAERQRDLNAAAFSGLPFAAGPLATGLADAILPRYGSAGGSHCVLIRFFSDFAISHEDTDQQTGGWGLQAAAVIDNVRLELSGSPILEEDFSGALDPRVSFINSSDSEVFGNWARLFQHITDNDVCTDNTTCAWLFTDHTTPTLFNDPSMAYGPSGYVIRNWLDDVVVSPWVSLATTPDHRTVLSFREFAGNGFQTSRVVRSWSVRGQDAGGCVGSWTTEEKRRVTLDDFTWRTHLEDISSLVDPSSTQIQVRYRVTDAQFAAPDAPPAPFIPGPGSYLDDVKIGRIPSTGPVIESHRGLDTRWQAQDAFTTVPAQIGYVPAYSDRFGTCAFSPGVDNAPRLSYAPCDDPALHVPVLGDSIVVKAFSPGTSTPLTAVDWYGIIVSGPHQGKAPPPFSVTSTGFFIVSAQHPQPTRTETRVADLWFVDLDDDYFRGGDVLRYFWFAEAGGQPGSLPPGIVNPNASLTVLEQNTGGIFEVNFLPTIAWDSGYLARIAADPQGGKLTPTAAELANSHQSTCILYVNKVNFNRRSGDANRTSFMSTLNRLGYRGAYDVYDLQGFGDTNNDLGGRACPLQAQGYAMIVHDSGSNSFAPLPDGSDIYTQKVNQAFWYRVYLAQANSGERGYANRICLAGSARSRLPVSEYCTANPFPAWPRETLDASLCACFRWCTDGVRGWWRESSPGSRRAVASARARERAPSGARAGGGAEERGADAAERPAARALGEKPSSRQAPSGTLLQRTPQDRSQTSRSQAWSPVRPEVSTAHPEACGRSARGQASGPMQLRRETRVARGAAAVPGRGASNPAARHTVRCFGRSMSEMWPSRAGPTPEADLERARSGRLAARTASAGSGC